MFEFYYWILNKNPKIAETVNISIQFRPIIVIQCKKGLFPAKYRHRNSNQIKKKIAITTTTLDELNVLIRHLPKLYPKPVR